MLNLKKFLKTGLMSPEFIWRLVVASFSAALIYAAVRQKIEDAIRDTRETKTTLTNLVAKVDSLHDEVLNTRTVVNGMDDRTKRIEHFIDETNLRRRGSFDRSTNNLALTP